MEDVNYIFEHDCDNFTMYMCEELTGKKTAKIEYLKIEIF